MTGTDRDYMLIESHCAVDQPDKRQKMDEIFKELNLELRMMGERSIVSDLHRDTFFENYGKRRRINLHGLDLRALPISSLVKFNPKYLELGSNNLMQLPEHFARISNVEELDLSFNHFTGIPPVLSQMPNLRKLDLEYNPLQSLEGIGDLPLLKILKLCSSPKGKAMALPREITKLKQLKNLSLVDFELGELPPYLAELENLEILVLRRAGLKELPVEMKNMKNLKSLSLEQNHFETIPDWIGELENLRLVVLTSNPVPEEEKTRIKEQLPIVMI